jgi:hypothetical protein
MASGAIQWEHWAQFEPRTKEAWKQVLRDHGFEPNTVGFPLVLEGDTMVVHEYLLNEDGRKYLVGEGHDREAAHRVVEVKLLTEVGLPRICREDP